MAATGGVRQTKGTRPAAPRSSAAGGARNRASRDSLGGEDGVDVDVALVANVRAAVGRSNPAPCVWLTGLVGWLGFSQMNEGPHVRGAAGTGQSRRL